MPHDNIFLFRPRSELDAELNVEEFIHRCRTELTVFDASLDWESNSWKGVVNFTKVGAPARGYKREQLLDCMIIPFAKAYVRYQQGHNPTKLKNEIKAIRCVEAALLKVKGQARIALTDISVLDEAVVVARAEYGSTAYQAGTQLGRLARFLNDNQLTMIPIYWKNPIAKPKEINRTGVEGKKGEKRNCQENLHWSAWRNCLLIIRKTLETNMLYLHSL